MMYNPYSLLNKTLLITGASSGIGRATAIECSRFGATCYIVGRNETKLKETISMMEGEHRYIVADVSTLEGILDIVSQIPKLDGVVNNAGITKTIPLPYLTEEDCYDIFSINTFAPMRLTSTLLKKKLMNRGASIVFTSSMDAERPECANSIYAASKGALTSFMKACAKELAAIQIRANAILPGMVETSFIKTPLVSDEDLQKDRNRYPLKRFGKPEEIAWLIIYLLSDTSSWMTGSAIQINGGINLN